MAAALALALVGLAAPSASAQGRTERPLSSQSVLFSRGSSLRLIAATGKGKSREVAVVGPGLVTRLEVADDGRTVLVEKGEEVAWVVIDAGAEDDPRTARQLPCRAPAHLSGDGKAVICRGSGGIGVRISLTPRSPASPASPGVENTAGSGPFFGFVPGGRLLIADKRGLWGVSPRSFRQPVRLALEPPDGRLLVAPNGRRAIGVYREKDSEAIYGLRLDGKGVRRRLLRGAEPVAWSRDSRWILAQQDHRACIARAVGGQYKCWRRHQVLAAAPDGSYVLLAKKPDKERKKKEPQFDIYRGRGEGVRPETPTLIVTEADSAAVWIDRAMPE